jgi:hypothetical protein
VFDGFYSFGVRKVKVLEMRSRRSALDCSLCTALLSHELSRKGFPLWESIYIVSFDIDLRIRTIMRKVILVQGYRPLD